LELPSQKLAFGLVNQVNVTRGEKIVRPLSYTQVKYSLLF